MQKGLLDSDDSKQGEMMIEIGTNLKGIQRHAHQRFNGHFNLPSPFAQWIEKLSTVVSHSRFFFHITGKARRFWLVHFRQQYVQNQLTLRRGTCRQCGFCCNLLFICPMLTKHGPCVAYDLYRPLSCKIFPVDQRDIDEVSLSGGHCGYRFKKKKP